MNLKTFLLLARKRWDAGAHSSIKTASPYGEIEFCHGNFFLGREQRYFVAEHMLAIDVWRIYDLGRDDWMANAGDKRFFEQNRAPSSVAYGNPRPLLDYFGVSKG